MKKFFLFVVAAVAALTINAQTVVELANVANYIDFQALSISDPDMTQSKITSTTPYTLANGTVLGGFLKSDGTEAEVTWNVKEDYNTTMPTPTWEGVDSLKVGTMLRAASGATISLGAFTTTADGKVTVYMQPNGDSDRGVSLSVYGGEPVEFLASGVKINGIRPAYAAEFELPAGYYDAGDVVIKFVVNKSNVFGIAVENLQVQSIDKANTGAKAVKSFENGQLVIIKNGVKYNALGVAL